MLRYDAAAGDICDLLSAIEAGASAELAAMRAYYRPGVVTGLAIVMTILRAYSDRARPWSADDWRNEWDRQLGVDSRRIVAPLDEIALFQPPLSTPEHAKPLGLEDVAGFCGIEHELKSRDEADVDAWIWAILGGMWRPYANYHRPTVRSSQLVVLPTDGTLGSEVRTLADAFTETVKQASRPAASAREHLPWLQPRPDSPTELATLPPPVLDIERAIRLVDDGRRAAIEPRNATWLTDKAGGVVDPHAAVRLQGKTIRPYRARTLGYHVLHCVLAGDHKTKPPAVIGAEHGQPLLRICQLAGKEGKTEGYHEVVLSAPERARRTFLLAARGQTNRPKELSDAFLRNRETARKQGAQIGALVTMGRVLRHALASFLQDETELDSHVKAAEREAGQRSVQLLLDLLDREPDPAAEQQAIHELVRGVGMWAFHRALDVPRPPLQAARAKRRLQSDFRKQLPLPADQEASTMQPPPLVQQSYAKLSSIKLSPQDKASIRGAGDTLPFLLVSKLASVAPPDELHGPASEAWLLVLRALGSMTHGGVRFGRALGETRYPELRMNQLCAATGAALFDLVGEALRWLQAHGVGRVDLSHALALMRADTLGDREARDWVRRQIALDYVRSADKRVVKSAA